MSITRKIQVACLAGIVPLTAGGWFAVQRTQDAMADEAVAGLARVADLEKGSVENALSSMDDRLAVATDRPTPWSRRPWPPSPSPTPCGRAPWATCSAP